MLKGVVTAQAATVLGILKSPRHSIYRGGKSSYRAGLIQGFKLTTRSAALIA